MLRKAARKVNVTWTVKQITGTRGRVRGKGSHVMWGLFDRDDNELARGSVTTHPGDMSWIVTKNFEDRLGKGWMDQ
jgi:hypothetical protein